MLGLLPLVLLLTTATSVSSSAQLGIGNDALLALYRGSACSSSVQVEVIGAGIGEVNGIYSSNSPDVAAGTTSGCFSWVDQTKPYYILNQTKSCNQQGLVDLYFSGTGWKISRNGMQVYQALSIAGPWTPYLNADSPPTSIMCYGVCDLPLLSWQV